MEETTSSLWLIDYGRLESVLRLSGCTYPLTIIQHIVPAVISWYLKRTIYGGRNQSGLVTLGNGQKALLPHLVRNPTKGRKPQRNVRLVRKFWQWARRTPFQEHTLNKPCKCALGSCGLPKTLVQKQQAERRVLSLQNKLKRETSPDTESGDWKHRRGPTESKLTPEKGRIARVVDKTISSLSDLHTRHCILCWENCSKRPQNDTPWGSGANSGKNQMGALVTPLRRLAKKKKITRPVCFVKQNKLFFVYDLFY